MERLPSSFNLAGAIFARPRSLNTRNERVCRGKKRRGEDRGGGKRAALSPRVVRDLQARVKRGVFRFRSGAGKNFRAATIPFPP